MTQSDRMYLLNVYCWNENDQSIVKAGFYSIPGSDEKHLFNIDTEVKEIGDDISKGFKFVGDGDFAILPETRLRIRVSDFFKGKLTGMAMRKTESALRMNVVNAQNGDRSVRICSVLTFDAAEEKVSFGGLTFTKRPRPPFQKKEDRNPKKNERSNESMGAPLKEEKKKKKEKQPKSKVESTIMDETKNEIINSGNPSMEELDAKQLNLCSARNPGMSLVLRQLVPIFLQVVIP